MISNKQYLCKIQKISCIYKFDYDQKSSIYPFVNLFCN